MTEKRAPYLPKEAADAMRQMGRIIGEKHEPEYRRRILRNIESFIQRGEWPCLELTDIPLLWYPNDPKRQAELLGKMEKAMKAGDLIPFAGQAFNATNLAAWKDAPPIPLNSPLIHFLPAWMDREGQREEVARQEPALTASIPVPCEYPHPPGNWKWANTRLMAKAAWQIECDNRRPATVDEVLKRMREWGNSGDEWELLPTDDKMPPEIPDTLKKEARKGAVLWQTKGGIPRSFDRKACEKALQRWRESSQQ